MNEKELIRAKIKPIKGVCIGIVCLGIIGFFIFCAIIQSRRPESDMDIIGLSIMFNWYAPRVVLPCVALAVLIYFMFSRVEMLITDKRVCGRVLFGKSVDLPIDSITSVGTWLISGISVATSSGKIKFLRISNRDEIHKVISDLIVKRQEKRILDTAVKRDVQLSGADEIKKYKELLDQEIISQEEFDKKKKQLLDL